MKFRHVRPEEKLAKELRVQRAGIKNSNSPTGTEKALTKETAEQAASDADDALRDAGDALEAALAAKTTADGRNRIYAQMVEPVTLPEVPFVQGDLWYVLDGDGYFSAVRVWDGASWADHRIVADSVLVPGSVGPVLIEDGAVTASKIAAAAIDGMVITGAVIRTAATGQRLELDSDGLHAYSETGDQLAVLNSSTGGLSVTGRLSILNNTSYGRQESDMSSSGATFLSNIEDWGDVSGIGILTNDEYARVGGYSYLGDLHNFELVADGSKAELKLKSGGGFDLSQVILRHEHPGGLEIITPYGEMGRTYRGTTAQRNAFTTADLAMSGDYWHNTSTGFDERYNGSEWVPQGLIAEGTITAQTQIDITGLEGANRYEVALILPTGSQSNDMSARLLTGSTENTSAVYDRMTLTGSATVAAAGNAMGETSWIGLVGGNRLQKTVTVTLMNLNQAEPTFADVVTNSWNATANPQIANLGLRHRTAASFNGIRFTVTGGGNVTGRYEVRAL